MTNPPNPDDSGLSEAARKELADAIAIVKADKMFAALHGRFTPKTPDPATPDDGKGKPPPAGKDPKDAKDPKDPPPAKDPADPPKKSGLWWGENAADDE